MALLTRQWTSSLFALQIKTTYQKTLVGLVWGKHTKIVMARVLDQIDDILWRTSQLEANGGQSVQDVV